MKKLLFVLLCVFVGAQAFSQQTDTQNTTQFDVIRNETVPGANTKGRIADAYEALNDSKKSWFIDGTCAGTNSYTVSGVNIAAYSSGTWFILAFTNANTSTTVTVTVNALATLALKDNEGNDLAIGDIKAGGTYIVRYNGTHLRIVGATGGSASSSVETIVAGNLIDVDATDPANPEIDVEVGDKGDVTIGANSLTVDANAITFAKMQAITDNRLLGSQGGTAVEELSLTANDFDLATNTLSIDYANGQTANGSTKGFLSAADWTTFNSKQTSFTTSSGLAALISDEVGTGFLPFTRPVINTQVASYVLVASDEWKEVQINAAGANNLELPPDAATPIGFQCVYRRTGAGQTTFTLGSGVTADFSAVVALDPGQNNLTHIFKDASNHYKVTNGSPGTTAALTASNAYMTTTIGGSPGNALNAAASVGVKFTGVTSVATGDLVQVTAADTWSVLAAVSAGSYLRSGGVSTASVWSTLKLPNTATANRVAYATSTNTIGEDADLTFNGTNLNTTTLTVGAGSTISGYISNTAALDFPSTAAGACEVLTITLTGAAVGDAVILGVDNASIPDPEYIYPTAWVSATNTVTVKGCNIQTVSALDPASGTFKVAIFK
jgi:hypothetical protein